MHHLRRNLQTLQTQKHKSNTKHKERKLHEKLAQNQRLSVNNRVGSSQQLQGILQRHLFLFFCIFFYFLLFFPIFCDVLRFFPIQPANISNAESKIQPKAQRNKILPKKFQTLQLELDLYMVLSYFFGR